MLKVFPTFGNFILYNLFRNFSLHKETYFKRPFYVQECSVYFCKETKKAFKIAICL